MDVSNDRNIAIPLQQSLFDVPEILRVFDRWRSDSNNLATGRRQFHRLANAGLGVHGVAGNHRLHPDRLVAADDHLPDFNLTGQPAPVAEWVRAEWNVSH